MTDDQKIIDLQRQGAAIQRRGDHLLVVSWILAALGGALAALLVVLILLEAQG